MKTLLKRNVFLICLTLGLCIGITALSYGQAVVAIDPAEVASPAVGGQLSVNIKISDGTGVAGYNITVDFDTSALQYVEMKNSTYLPAGAFAAPAQVSGGRVTLAATSLSGAASAKSGTLATLKFKVVAVKASTLRLTEVILSDSAATALSVTKRNGEVVVRQSAPWDLNNDGTVNVLDLTLVARDLGKTGSPAGDVNGDGSVNVLDLVLVAQHLGETTGGGVTTSPVDGGGTTQPSTPTRITTPVDGRTMVLIPAGEFQMGSDDADSGVNEQPVHTVHVDVFYMDTHEVTNLDFKRFVLANPQWQKSRIPKVLHNGNYLKHWDNSNNYPAGKANHPVIFVSWYAAMAYAEWAGKRLPTEAEWEKAARGSKAGLKYPWGNTISSTRANYGQSWNGKSTAAIPTRVVGSYAANGYGLYDMAGNVWEWCLDAYNKDFYFSSPSRNPLSDVNTISNLELITDNYTDVKSSRVLRGGSWGLSATYVRVASRVNSTPSNTGNYFGFRCARAVE